MEKKFSLDEIKNLSDLLSSSDVSTWEIALELAKNSNATKDKSFATLMFTCAYFDPETKKRQACKKILAKLSPTLLELGKGKFKANVIQSDNLSKEATFQETVLEVMRHALIDKQVAFAFLLAAFRDNSKASSWIEPMAMQLEAYPPEEFWVRNFSFEGDIDIKDGSVFGTAIKKPRLYIPSYLVEDIPFSEKLLEGLDLSVVEALIMKTKRVENILPFCKLTNLKYLELASEGIDTLPPEVGNWKKLTFANFKYCNFKSLPKEIKNWKKLQSLDLRSNSVSHLPEALFELTNLKFLWLIGNQVENISDKLGQLVNLELLELSANPFERLPDVFESIPKLIKLGLRQSSLKRLPDSIGSLEKLNYFDPESADLENLPAVLKWTNLTRLGIHYSKIKKLPDSICQLPNLKILEISDSQIESLPANIGDLPLLEELSLRSNAIRELPASLSQAKSLKKLNLADNKLNYSQAAPILGKCERLTFLGLARTKMSVFPLELLENKSISQLNLAMNIDLEDLPDAIIEMAHLENIAVTGTSIPQDRGREINALFPKKIIHINHLKTPDEIRKMQFEAKVVEEGMKLVKAAAKDGVGANTKNPSEQNVLQKLFAWFTSRK